MIHKNKYPILFLDSGDTFVDESTQIYDENGTVIDAQLYDGSKEFLLKIKQEGYTIALVADGRHKSFENVYKKYGLWDVFEQKIISEVVGEQKPNLLMFKTALKAFHLDSSDYSRIFMVGNNIRKDVLGANKMGFISIWMNWSPRYYQIPRDTKEIADYVVKTPQELYELIHEFSLKLD